MLGHWWWREGVPEQRDSVCKGARATEQSRFWREARCSVWLGYRWEGHSKVKENREASRWESCHANKFFWLVKDFKQENDEVRWIIRNVSGHREESELCPPQPATLYLEQQILLNVGIMPSVKPFLGFPGLSEVQFSKRNWPPYYYFSLASIAYLRTNSSRECKRHLSACCAEKQPISASKTRHTSFLCLMSHNGVHRARSP